MGPVTRRTGRTLGLPRCCRRRPAPRVARRGSLAAAARAAEPGARDAARQRARACPHVDRARRDGRASRSTSRRARSSSPATPPRRSRPPRTRSSRSAYAALDALGPAYRFHDRGARQRRARRRDVERQPRPQGRRRPDALEPATSRGSRAQVRASGIRRVTGGELADESLLRHAADGAGLEASFYINESPPLSALVVDRAWYGGTDVRRTRRSRRRAIFRTRSAQPASRSTAVAAWPAPPAPRCSRRTSRAPLARDPPLMDRDSDNFTAEMLLKQLGAVAAARRHDRRRRARSCGACSATAGVPLGRRPDRRRVRALARSTG